MQEILEDLWRVCSRRRSSSPNLHLHLFPCGHPRSPLRLHTPCEARCLFAVRSTPYAAGPASEPLQRYANASSESTVAGEREAPPKHRSEARAGYLSLAVPDSAGGVDEETVPGWNRGHPSPTSTGGLPGACLDQGAVLIILSACLRCQCMASLAPSSSTESMLPRFLGLPCKAEE